LPANGIIDENGNAYTGNVNVAMAWIDPSAEDLAQRMVGDLSGIDENGNERSLGSYGMLQIELLDETGKELNLGNGSEAELIFPVPASMQGNAPETIPLWSYDEDMGTWIQEGTAAYANGVYTGKVSHFSSWNVDCMTDPIEMKGQVVWQRGSDLEAGSYLQLYVCSEKIGRKGGWLCDDGSFLFYNFPKGETFQLKVLDRCGNTLFEKDYGAYDEDTDLGQIQIVATANTSHNLVKIVGNAVDCDGNALTRGYVSTDYTGNGPQTKTIFPLNENGNFEFTLDLCDNTTVNFTVVDTDNILTSTPQSLNDTENSWTFADISVCGGLTDYVEVSINNEASVVYLSGGFVAKSDFLIALVYSRGDSLGFADLNFSLDMPFPIIGAPELNTPFLAPWGSYRVGDLANPTVYSTTEAGTQLELTFTKFDIAPGGFAEGFFNGTITNMILIDGEPDAPGDIVPISGSFSVPIEQ